MSHPRDYQFAEDMLSLLVSNWPAPSEPDCIRPLPGRRWVNFSLPAYDCEQVTVSLERAAPTDGDPSQEFASPGLAGLKVSLFAVTVIRCVPVPAERGGRITNPAPDALSAVACTVMRDKEQVWDVLRAAVKAGLLPGCRTVAYDSWTAEQADGGFGGGTTRVRAILL